MEADFKTKLDEDLTRRLYHLYAMKLQPALHLSQRFDSIINTIDYDAERILMHIAKTPEAADKANDVRCEFVRILKLLEQHLQTRLLSNVPRGACEAFEALEQRVKAFQEKLFSREEDAVNDTEDSYVRLVLEITEMANATESNIFRDQTIFYECSTDQSKLGCLVHVSDVTLSNEHIECLRSFFRDPRIALDPAVKDVLDLIHQITERLFNQSLVVSVNRPFVVTKGLVAMNSIVEHLGSKTIEMPQVIQCVSSDHDFLVITVDRAKVGQTILHYQPIPSLGGLAIQGFAYIPKPPTSTIQLNGNRLRSLDSQVVAGFKHLAELDLSSNRLQSLHEDLLANCSNLQRLHLQNACHPDARFSLSFLPSVSKKLEHLSVTLPVGPADFGLFSKMSNLEQLAIHGASSQDSNRETQELTRQHLSQINSNNLNKFTLSHFNLPIIDQIVLTSFKNLTFLYLSHCNIKSIHHGSFKPCSYLKSLDLSCNQIPQLNDNMFADLPSLTELNLRYNQISELSVGCFGGLSKLEYINLTGNRVRGFAPGVFECLENLQYLELAGNELTHVGRGFFDGLNKLTHLDLGHNPIESIEDDAFAHCNRLECLSLDHCQLKAIQSRMFTGLNSLEYLYLNYNQIDSFQIKTDDDESVEIKSPNMTPRELELVREYMFAGLSHLCKLSMAGNQFTKLDLRVFCNLPDSCHLDLSSNKIDELNGEISGRVLARSIQLDLSKNRLTSVSKVSFPGALELLNLNDNPIKTCRRYLTVGAQISRFRFESAVARATFKSKTRSSAVGLEGIGMVTFDHEQFLVSNARSRDILTLWRAKNRTQVRKLALDNCSFKTAVGLELSARLPHLTHLYLHWNKLERIEARWLQSFNNLKTLHLQGNQIETLDEANMFVNCPNLSKLNLSSNNCLRSLNRRIFHGLYRLEELTLSNNPGLSSIDDGLFRSLFNVSKISLSGNNIKQLNLPRLFDSCRHLTHLDLSNNQLDNRTFNLESMGHLTYLQELLLNDNQLESIEFVKDMLELETLELKNNKIETIEKGSCNLLGRLRSLKTLDLSANRIKSLNQDLFAHLQHQLVKLDIAGNLFNSNHELVSWFSKFKAI